MPRIRSVHPCLFTDEAWVSCSPLARVLYIGLMTDADDQGLFEWKPLQIKMRLLPADHADIPELLAELIAANLIASLESSGKKLGAIRYFRRFQRPKKANATFPLPAEWAPYVGLTTSGSDTDGEPVGNQFPTSGEKSPQMEDGGCNKYISADESASPDPSGKPKARKPASQPAPSPLQSTVEAIWAAAPKVSRTRSSRADVSRTLTAAVSRGHAPAAILAGLKAYFASDDVTRDDGQFAKGVHRMIEADRWAEFAAEAAPTIDPSEMTDADWTRRLNALDRGKWSPAWGSQPGEPGCLVPARLILAAA